MRVNATAPLRIDIGGGVTDVPELGREVGTSLVNVAIDVYDDPGYNSRRSIEAEASFSGDLSNHVLFNGEVLEVDSPPGEHEFITQLFSSFVAKNRPQRGITLSVADTLPKGTGLGGSASLSLSILATLYRLNGEEAADLTADQLVKRAHYFETVEMSIPGGCQDYIAAFFGGSNYIDFSSLQEAQLASARTLGQPLSPAVETFLNEHMLIIVQRSENISSGDIVADEVRNFTQDRTRIGAYLQEIKRCNRDIYALLQQPAPNELAVGGLARAMQSSWEAQKRLSPLIQKTFIRQIEEVVQPCVYALRGPGAGGNSLFLLVKPEKRELLLQHLKRFKESVAVLYGRVNNEGLSIVTSPDV